MGKSFCVLERRPDFFLLMSLCVMSVFFMGDRGHVQVPPAEFKKIIPN